MLLREAEPGRSLLAFMVIDKLGAEVSSSVHSVVEHKQEFSKAKRSLLGRELVFETYINIILGFPD